MQHVIKLDGEAFQERLKLNLSSKVSKYDNELPSVNDSLIKFILSSIQAKRSNEFEISPS